MLFIYLHIITMFLAVALSVGPGLILQRIAATENVPAIRAAFGAAQPLGRIAPMVYGVGFLLGIIAAIVASYNLLKPWLLISYVLFVISSVLGARVTNGWVANVSRAAETNSGDTPSAELKQLLHNKGAQQGLIANLVVIALIIVMMVFKPFGA